MTNIIKNLRDVKQAIAQSADDCGRSADEITLLAVSKTKPAQMIREAWQAGQRHFGENYCQEAEQKAAKLADLDIVWHFIGPIQSNKTRPISTLFNWVHTVEREKIARRLNDQRPENLPPLNVCIQVNIDGEESKAGVTLEELDELASVIATLPRLCLRGLMAIPAVRSDPAAQHQPFRRLHEAQLKLSDQFPDCDTLSMGMSNDMTAAIAEGATVVRIGTAIFGAR